VNAEITAIETALGTNFSALASLALTFTNKRYTSRVLALSSNSATPTFNTNNFDYIHITGQSASITSFTSGVTGTPVDGDDLHISVTSTGTIAYTWGTLYEASSLVALPTGITGVARVDYWFAWNTETSKYRIQGYS